MTVARCPTCGTDLAGRSICHRCGTLVGIESRINKVKRDVTAFVQNRTSALPRNIKSHHFLWLCAVMPILLVPAIVSLVYALRSMRNRNRSINADFEWIAVVSAINIVVSALLLYKFYFVINDFYLQTPEDIRKFFRNFLPSFGPDRPPAKITPV